VHRFVSVYPELQFGHKDKVVQGLSHCNLKIRLPLTATKGLAG